MKHKETDYLDSLFAVAENEPSAADIAFPLIEVPEGLRNKLYAIADTVPATRDKASSKRSRPRYFVNWPTLGSIAATLMITMLGFQFYQQQQTLKHLEQAQADLATALHYLGEANRIAQTQLLDSLNDTITNEANNDRTNAKARQKDSARPWVEPALSTETDALMPYSEARESEYPIPNRRL